MKRDVGESATTFGQRFKEHIKAPSPIYGLQTTTSHPTTLHDLNIVDREGQSSVRTIKESIYIRVNNPTINRNTGKYSLLYIWNGVLVNNAKPQIKNQQDHQHQVYRTSLTPSRTSGSYINADIYVQT